MTLPAPGVAAARTVGLALGAVALTLACATGDAVRGAPPLANVTADRITEESRQMFVTRRFFFLPVRIDLAPTDDFVLPAELLRLLQTKAIDDDAARALRRFLQRTVVDYDAGGIHLSDDARRLVADGQGAEIVARMDARFDPWLAGPEREAYDYLKKRPGIEKQYGVEETGNQDRGAADVPESVARRLLELDSMVVFRNPAPAEYAVMARAEDRDAYLGQIYEEHLAAKLRGGVDALVASELFQRKSAEATVSRFMREALGSEVWSLVQSLDGPWREAVSGTRIVIGPPTSSAILHAETEVVDKAVTMRFSPALVRAMFAYPYYPSGLSLVKMDAASKRCQSGREVQRRQLFGDPRRDGQTKDACDVFNRLRGDTKGLVADYKAAFHGFAAFTLAHELAHAYLGDGRGVELDEFKVDCHALMHLDRDARKASLGLFETMVYGAARERKAALWGVTERELKEIEGRRANLERVDRARVGGRVTPELCSGQRAARR